MKKKPNPKKKTPKTKKPTSYSAATKKTTRGKSTRVEKGLGNTSAETIVGITKGAPTVRSTSKESSLEKITKTLALLNKRASQTKMSPKKLEGFFKLTEKLATFSQTALN